MYATLQDMMTAFDRDELLQLTDEERAGQIGVARIDLALTQAGTEIDSYIAAIYALPVASVPPVLTNHACDIARYRLWSRRSEMPDAVRLAYNASVSWLKSVASGAVKLPLPSGAEAPAAQNTVLFDTPGRVFSRDSLRGL